MFSLIEQSGRNACYRCNQKMTVDDYSIEHMEAWQPAEDPIKAFYDLANISFSHKTCNYKAAVRTVKSQICPKGHNEWMVMSKTAVRANHRICKACHRINMQIFRAKKSGDSGRI